MWGADDTFGRWVQLVCAVVLLPLCAALEYWWWTDPSYSSSRHIIGALGAGGLYLGLRCLWYAITGRNNINSDDLNSGNFQ